MATNTSTPGEHRPLAEATVALYEAEPWDPGQGKPIGDLLMTAQTDPNGEYWLDYHLLPEGPAVTYTLVVSSTLVHAIDVVAPPPANGTAENSIAFPIYTPTGYYPDNQFIVEPNVIPTWRHWSFSGQVVDASTGDPVPGVVMVLYGANNIDEPENVLAGAATDNTGRYQLDASLLESENYQYFVLAVEDYATSAVGATSNSGGVVTGDNRVYFPNPPPDTFPDNNFSVPHNPDEGMQSMALTSGVKNQPVVAMILNYNCSCGTSSDCQHITNTKVLSAFGETLFSSTQASHHRYFLENSQGNLGLNQAGLFMITPTDDPITTVDEASNCSSGNSLEKDRAYFVDNLLGDQLGFNYANYDSDGNGVVDNSELIVVVAYATPNLNISKVRSTDPAQIQMGDVKVELDVVSTSVAQDFYTIAHELAHALVWTQRDGSPGDNYGGDGNPGAYGLMDNHCTGSNTPSLTPNTPLTGTIRMYGRLPHLDPWNKIQFGWIYPDTYSSPAWASFDAIEADGEVFRVGYKSATKEYFLVENRSPSSSEFDTDLLDEGLAIWHINESYMPDERRVIALERAGGGANSGQATNNCDDDNDNTALWDGSEDFWNGSSPASKWDNNSNSQVAVASISQPGEQISAYLSSAWNQTILAHDEDEPNNSFEYALPISAGSFNRNLHASCDTDVYTITHWTSATLGVTVNAYLDASHTQPTTAPTVLLEGDGLASTTSYQGVGNVSGFFKDYGNTYIQISGSAQPVYYTMVVSNSQATMPPDRFDDSSPPGEQPNDTFALRTVISETINENLVLLPGLEVDELNFHVRGDIDYFTIQLPDEVSASGHSECLDPSDPLYGPEVITGTVIINVEPVIKRAFDINIYNSSGYELNIYDSLGPWTMQIDCPHDHFSNGKVHLSFEDDSGGQNIYKIQVNYSRWTVRMDFPEWLFDTDPPLIPPIPEIYDPRLQFVYPQNKIIQWAILEGVAPPVLPTEYYPMHHDSAGPLMLELFTQGGKNLNLSLFDSNQNLVGIATPPALPGRLNVNATQSENPPTRRLFIPNLPAGWYALALDGANGFTEFWLKFDKHTTYLPLVRR